MVTHSDKPLASSAEVYILFNGYASERVASTVAFVRDGDIRVIIDPGMVPGPGAILEPLAALGVSPSAITTRTIPSTRHCSQTPAFMITGLFTRTISGTADPPKASMSRLLSA